MTIGIRMPLAAICVAAAMGAAPPARAQGGVPLGSTTIAGPADSAFGQFLVFLKSHGDSVITVDSRQRVIEARVEGSDELVIFRFQGHGDSTTVAAQGKKGGMAPLIMGLGVVDDWLKSRNGSRADSSRH